MEKPAVVNDLFGRDRDWAAGVVGYPDPAVEVLDPRFNVCRVLAAGIERLWTGGRWLEGPVWFGDARQLLFSDLPNDRILRWCAQTGQTTIFRTPTEFTNGNARDRQGRLLSCRQGDRSIARTEHDGTVTVLMDRFDGKRLNGPNDIICHPDGQIWFTDPGYGTLSDYEGHRGDAELPTRIYRLDPESGVAIVADESLRRPNGLCFSGDLRRLYAVDTGCTDDPGHSRQIQVFDVADSGRLRSRRDFCDMAPGRSDGIRCDSVGNLWAASGFGGAENDGVHVFAPDGTRIARIHLPEPCANLCFGGIKRNRLFMVASQSLYSIFVDVAGL